MSAVKCGDIVSVRLDSNNDDVATHTLGYGVVVSADIINENLKMVLACPLLEAKGVSSSRIGATFLPKGKTGLDSNFLALSLQVRTIPKERITKRISALPGGYLSQIKESLKAVLDLDA